MSLALLTPEALPSGQRAILLPSAVNDIVAAVVFLPLPGAVESPKEAGLVHFLHRMLLRGTTRRSGAELHEVIDSLGITISSDGADDYSVAHLVATSDTFAEGLDLLAEVIQSPSLEPEEIEKERQTVLAAIRRKDDDKMSVAVRRFARELYGTHPYGFERLGLKETVGEFTREQLLHLHQEFVDPARSLAVIVGNFDPVEARERLASIFQPSAEAGATFAPPPIVPVAATRIREKREAEQANLVLGFHAPAFNSPDWPAVRVLNTVLGEGMSSRLFTRLRDEKGLAYATGSSYAPLREGGHLFGYIGTKPASLDFARDEMIVQMRLLATELVPDDELQRSKNYMVGKFLIDHQTNYRRAFYLGFYEAMGAGLDMDERYPGLIQSVTAEQVRAAAERYLLAEPTVVEIVPEG